MTLSPKERLERVLEKKTVDRPPVICPGGMMNSAVVDIMNKTGHTLPEAHKDAKLMAELAHDVSVETGFENFGAPFCLTVEPEVLGSEINFGTLKCEPKIEKEVFDSVKNVEYKNIDKALQSGRIYSVVEACSILSKKYIDVPVLGNLSGPISTAASIVDPMTFLKELRKDKENSHKVLNYVTDFLIKYAEILIDNGVKIISIGDPTATGEILGPKMFDEYAVFYLNKLIDSIHKRGAKVIVHICGNMNNVSNLISKLRDDAISVDAMVNLKQLKEQDNNLTTMGNLSTFLLEFSEKEKIETATEKLIFDGINIISPACGLSTSTPLSSIKTMTETVKGLK
jgi:MtaA/CmuA family methyltransferase